MAAVNISLHKLSDYNLPSVAVATANLVTALDASDGALVDFDARDNKILLLLQNSASSESTATIKAGNGLGGVNDLVITLPASSFVTLALDSSRFKFVTGENKGKIHLTGAATIKVAAFKLP
jgi:hypothetical protein